MFESLQLYQLREAKTRHSSSDDVPLVKTGSFDLRNNSQVKERQSSIKVRPSGFIVLFVIGLVNVKLEYHFFEYLRRTKIIFS